MGSLSNIEEADIVIGRVSSDITTNAQPMIDEAKAAGKKLILAVQASNGGFSGSAAEPDSNIAENTDGLLMMTYNCQPDHGSSMGNFYTYTTPSVLADIIFGEKEPEGKLLYEISRNSEDAYFDWGELAYDTEVDMPTRLYMAATVRQNPTAELPDNLGNVLYGANFGMHYSQKADIDINTLVMDQETVTTQQENFFTGEMEYVVSAVNKTVKAGEPFKIYMIADNKGADGTVMAEAYEGDTLLSSELVSVKGDSFAIVTMDITLDQAGDHTLTVGDQTINVTVK